MTEEFDINVVTEKIGQGDPKREEIIKQLYIELTKYFRNNPEIVVTKREQKSFVEGMLFYIQFDVTLSKNEISRLETEIHKAESEIEQMKRGYLND